MELHTGGDRKSIISSRTASTCTFTKHSPPTVVWHAVLMAEPNLSPVCPAPQTAAASNHTTGIPLLPGDHTRRSCHRL